MRYTLNDDWRFLPDGVEFAEKAWLSDAGWQRVNVPHTWNATDPFDDVESYRRGASWYRKHFTLADSLRGRRLLLHFEGANQVARVYVNGAFVGQHKGGYTAFTVDFTRHARFGADNLVAVEVDNSHDPMIPPLSVGFALYGGIYRDVWLVATDPVHVTTSDLGSSGVAVTTPEVSAERGTVRVRGAVTNDGAPARQLRVVSTVLDAAGREVARGETSVTAAPNASAGFDTALPPVARPHLWSPDDPYLYAVYTDVYDGARLADRVTSPLGFRWFRFGPDGFFLNGKKTFLRGTNRHQDYAGLGSALSNTQHVRDLEIIKTMGANFLRLAHYPQDPAVLDAADRLGLLIWEEVPVVNHITVDSEFTRNAQTMLREMIRQHRNHPSVVTWGIMNEVFLWSEAGERIGRQSDTTYMREVRDFAHGMDAVARAEDPSRFTTMAIHGATSYDESGVAAITQILGLNLYNGWYSGTLDEFGPTLDRRHAKSPSQAIVVSEYGSGSELRLNAVVPERFDHSGAYHRLYHESYLRQARARPWLAGTAVWNEFDFAQPHIGESTPNMNKKGLLTFDRQPKDVYYLYKANWNPTPMVYVASRDWRHRAGIDSTGARTVTQPVDVYSNAGPVELLVNGKSLGTRAPDDVTKASWQVPFAAGDNVIEARAGKVVDRLVIRMDVVPRALRDTTWREIAVNVGSNAQYFDDTGPVWLEDRAYAPGSFGYVGGKAALMAREIVITDTKQTPLYVTYRAGLDAYRFDVPDGDYELELRFAEPGGAQGAGAAGGALPPGEAPGAHAFGVAVNGRTLVERLDLATRRNVAPARPITTEVSATNGSGVVVTFRPIAGQAVLNAIRIRRK
ncbi:glycoside hydrolase family 2 TIM barrel (plasmid) [Gemmatirosa kalamazoonensis]|uniref:Glycoside hydrolase family 2 TIM barrel n=1 Tax=Gemmatirosa kalamazoonensis TaxID=861299 RepID=W0RRM3_9BACT|nr:glycoside hydrolase family 2 TIM barrel-domain containing protein [Gemmatirosa kalamazoonensis]AHG92975.1 glycoside hydrolase family 2 TIM barrel [Gemmatirosa kalamazoonensis]